MAARSSRSIVCLAFAFISLIGMAFYCVADTITIRVGIYDNAPKIYANEQGLVSGFWPDLIRQIAIDEGWEIEWVAGSWSDCLERLEAGAIDILPDTGWTEPRSQRFAFTQETVLTSWSLVYVPRGSDIKSILDLDGMTIAALRGSFNLDGPKGIRELVEAFHLDVTFVEMADYDLVFEALDENTVDAGVTNKDFGSQHEGQVDIQRTPILFQPARMQFALPKAAPLTPYLIERIDAAMKDYKQDMTSIYYRALDEHIGRQEAQVSVAIIPRWARTILLSGSSIVLFLLAVGITSRIQVRRRTSELRESEARFQIATDQSADAIFITDPQGSYTYVNQAASDLLGYSRQELLSMSILDATPDEDTDQVRKRHRTLQEQGQLYTEITLQRHDGSLVSVDLNAVVLPNGSIYGSCRDITHRINIREKLMQESVELAAINKIGLAVGANIGIQAVFETIYEQLSTLMDTPDFRIRLCDSKRETIQSVFKIRDGQNSEIGEEHPFRSGRTEHIIRTEEPLLLSNMTARQYRKLGIITRNPFVSYVGVPLRASGQVIGVLSLRSAEDGQAFNESHLSILTAVASQAAASIENARLYEQAQKEIVSRQESAEVLQASEARYRDLFENAPVPLWEQDFTNVRQALRELRQLGINNVEAYFSSNPDDLVRYADLITVTDVNRAAVSLFHAESKISLMHSIVSVFVEESTSVLLQSLLSIDAGVGSFESDLILQTLDGDRLVVVFQWTEIQSRALVSIQDITDRVRAEEEKLAVEAQLRQAQKLESIGTLASGVAHEINNPLMGMMNYAELVKDKAQDPKAIEYLTGIGVEGNRIAKIVRNLLSFSRQDTEEHGPARLTDIIDQSLSLVGSILRKDQITIEVDVSEDLPTLRCRSQQIQQVIINLLTNAHAALNARYPEYDKNKIIRITAHPFEQDGSHWIRATVEDHGTGIPIDVKQRIFDPFYTTKSRHEGTGLGLSVSFGIVKEHQGDLTVESVPREMTRFHIDLPIDGS